MNCQRGHALQVELLLACRTVSIDSAFHVPMLLKEMLRELIRVKEYIKADLARKYAPLVLSYQMCPHLETVLELLSTEFALGLVCGRLFLLEFLPWQHTLFSVRLIRWLHWVFMVVHFKEVAWGHILLVFLGFLFH